MVFFESAKNSKSTIAVLDAHFPGYPGKDLWTASFPDLNPIDFSVSVNTLKIAHQKAWDDIDVDYCRRTADSVIKRSNFEYLL
ncbi:unnamed protein product [Caenorhabditis nigoni]